MAFNSISKLTWPHQSSMYFLPNALTQADMEDDTYEASEDKSEKLHFGLCNVVFEQDSCNGNGKL